MDSYRIFRAQLASIWLNLASFNHKAFLVELSFQVYTRPKILYAFQHLAKTLLRMNVVLTLQGANIYTFR